MSQSQKQSANEDLVLPWTEKGLKRKQEIQALLQQNDEKYDELMQIFTDLNQRVGQHREDIREHGKALDKMIEKNNKTHAQNLAILNQIEGRVSRLETNCARVLTALVANERSSTSDTEPTSPTRRSYHGGRGSSTSGKGDGSSYDLQ